MPAQKKHTLKAFRSRKTISPLRFRSRVTAAGRINKKIGLSHKHGIYAVRQSFFYLIHFFKLYASLSSKAIFERHLSISKIIRPLVLIKLPNGQPETISAVEINSNQWAVHMITVW